ncbi:hypothetical protein AJ79_04739 [Helicocarpus griseus UAMH5409]|uniref:Uncharacterized protein n=1 Tax=Helicocarpus griseus UAMH5409 TaxID=1447875 RepID=A0A2B7XR66_9EURO|nr:hypothetical protein AJ79_04739 [Helicocarpus griseus UAMH5409]
MSTRYRRTACSPRPSKVPKYEYQSGHGTASTSYESPDTKRYLKNVSDPARTPRLNDGNDNITVEDITAQDTGYEGDVEVVAPYEYEEAESGPSTPQSANKSGETNELDLDDLGKSGLIDSMKALGCDSDITDYGNRRLQIRGRKRKAGDSIGGRSTSNPPDCSSDPGYVEVVELEGGERVLTTPDKSRKRRRIFTCSGDVNDSQSAEKSSSDYDRSIRGPGGNSGLKTAAENVDRMDVG